MAEKGYSDELQRALARSDAGKMIRQIDDYADYFADGAGDWPDEYSDDFDEIVRCHHDEPEKALAYVVIAASRSDDARFLGYMACGPLEDVLRDPPADLLDRIVAEARKSARFRWLLSNPYKVAIAESAWEAIEKYRITGPHEEPADDTLPPRRVS
ncbi:MAG TPA: hypothetical protein VF605_05530 [Allosphingosinicella sp.]